MKISAAIVEDDNVQAKMLADCLSDLADQDKVFEIVCFDSAEAFLATFQKRKYQLVLLDIQLKKMDGLSCARRIRAIDKDLILVFITSMAQFAINGYEVDAKDYILKPLILDVFRSKIERILPLIKENKDVLINIAPDNMTPDMVRPEDILFVENYGHKVIYHLQDREREVYGTIGRIEETLKAYRFLRCNRNTVINTAYIRSVHDGIVQLDDYDFTISSTRKKIFLSELNELLEG